MGYEVDFLPVGDTKSGDAIALRFGNLYGTRTEQTVVVIDGGFQQDGQALGYHIARHYATDRIDLVISTHPDADHIGGLEYLITHFQVGELWMHLPWRHTDNIARMFQNDRVTDGGVREALRRSLEGARSLERLAQQRRVPVIEPFRGHSNHTGNLRVLGPRIEFYRNLLPQFRGTPGPAHNPFFRALLGTGKEAANNLLESWGLETLDDSGVTSAENETSVVLLVRVDGHDLLFTADAGIQALTEVANYLEAISYDRGRLRFFQVPHHGSRRNVGPSVLDRLVGSRLVTDGPPARTALVSAAPNAGPKHPSKRVTNAFRRRGVAVHATQGQAKYHWYNAPNRGWSDSVPLPFFPFVDELED